jgi:hypothetical protein
MNLNPTITRYADEPHPNDEYAWKRWWVAKFFPPKKPLTARAIEWTHECWQTTKALWHTSDVTRRHNRDIGSGKSAP